MYDVIVPVAIRSNASSFNRNNANGFKTEYSYKIILLQFLLTREKVNNCTFATPRRDASVGHHWVSVLV